MNRLIVTILAGLILAGQAHATDRDQAIAEVQQELTDLKLCNEWAAAMEGIVIPGVDPFPWPRKRECLRRLGYKAEIQ